MDHLEESKMLKAASAELNELRQGVPKGVDNNFLDYAKWFPFGYILMLIHFSFFATKYGPTIYMVIKLNTRIDKIKAYKESLKE